MSREQELEQRVAQLEIELRDAQQSLANEDAKMIAGGIAQALGQRVENPGKIDLLRQQLRQELAYSAYLEENLKPGTPSFNTLPQDKRAEYFQRIDSRI